MSSRIVHVASLSNNCNDPSGTESSLSLPDQDGPTDGQHAATKECRLVGMYSLRSKVVRSQEWGRTEGVDTNHETLLVDVPRLAVT